MKFFIIVKTPNGLEYGRSSDGKIYNYPTYDQAATAARLWGDAYDQGKVHVVTEKGADTLIRADQRKRAKREKKR